MTRSAPTRPSREWLTADEIERAMDLDHHLAGIAATYRALGLDDAELRRASRRCDAG